MQKFPMFLAGKCSTPNQDLLIRDKYTNQIIATAPLATEDHFEKAIQAGCAAAKVMQRLTGAGRKRVLTQCVERLQKNRQLFVQTLVQEAGKPIAFADLEVDRCIETFSLAAEETTRLEGQVIPLDGTARGAGYTGMTRLFPIGLCSFITPFNFPLNLVAHKVAPAIAAGCPFILKPASWTPMCALMLGDILLECGLPEEAFSILPATRSASSSLIVDDRIEFLSFTGSDSVGWQMKRDCGRKRICLELGGNANCIVDEGYEWQSIIPKIISAAFGQSGQSCISLQRLLIHRSIYDAMLDKLIAAAVEVRYGDPTDPSTVVGPMIDVAEADRVLDWVEKSKTAGARELLASRKLEGTSVITPGLLDRVPEDQSLCCDEVFGPVLITEPFEEFDEALDKVNRSKFGLQTGVFTDSIKHAWQAWEQLKVGGVIVGDTPNTRFDSMPYGGVKASGMGREGVRYAINDMTNERLLVLRQNVEV
jgi:acyl-CoA reductase-like NAD-dependent aldehyde dehydrogenase